MTNEELDALQALCDGATAGPWGVTGAFNQLVDSAPDSDDPRTITAEVWKRNAMREPTEQGKADLSFIAASRTALPALIAEVRRLTERCDAAERDLAIGRDCLTCALFDECPDDCDRHGNKWIWRAPQPAKEDDQ